MAVIDNIYDINGLPLITFDGTNVDLNGSPSHEEEMMKSNFISISWNDTVKRVLPAGAYITYNGVRYRLLDPYQPQQKSECEFSYSPEFQHPVMWLGRVPFILPTGDTSSWDKATKETDWTYTGSAITIMTRFLEILNRWLPYIDSNVGAEFGHRWTLEMSNNLAASVTCTFSNMDILSALSECATQWNCQWHLDWKHKVLFFGDLAEKRDNYQDTPTVLKSGDNVSVANVSETKEDYYNCFLVKGGTRNISQPTTNGYEQVYKRLTLPAEYKDSIIDERTDSSEPKMVKELIFDDIYPKVDLYCYNVRERRLYLTDDDGNRVKNDDGTYKKWSIWYMRLAYQVNGTWKDYIINPDKDIINGENLSVQFQANLDSPLDSPLAGRDFELTYHEKAEHIKNDDDIDENGFDVLAGDYEIVHTEENDLIIPTVKELGLYPRSNGTSLSNVSKKDNRCTLYNIVITDDYYNVAKEELLSTAKTEIKRLRADLNNYTVSSNPVIFEDALNEDSQYRELSQLYVGQDISYNDGQDLNGGTSYILDTHIVKLVTKLDYPFEQEITLGNDVVQGTVSQLKDDVKTIISGFSSGGNSSGFTEYQVAQMVANYGDRRYLSKRKNDLARGRITFEQGLRIGLDENGYIDEKGNAELLSIVVRAMLRSPKFMNGFTGEGWRLWLEDGLSKLEIDELTVRRAMRIFELLIDKIRSVGGQIIVSAANGKIKNVESTDTEYRIEFETANEFVGGDLMRMGVFTGNELRSYWVEVSDVVGGKVIINKTEFEDWVTEPKVGDEVVLMGNTKNANRQNLISISATEDGQPRIEVLGGVKEKNFAGGQRTRLGNLDGISDSYFPADSQPHGNGLYADNAYLRGRFVVVNRDGSSKDILTMFDITEGKIESAVSALRRDTTDQGILSNGTFGKGLKSWTTENEWKPLFNSDNPLWDSKGIVQGGNIVVSVADDMGYTSAEINNSYIMQKNEDMREIPEFYAPDGNAKDARTVYLSFFYRCETAGTLKVGFQDLNKTGFNDFEAMSEERVLNATEGYTQYTLSGKWNGTGNLLISFTGKIHIAGVVLSENQNDALVYRYSTLFEQSDQLVKIAAKNFDVNGNVLEESDIITTAKYNTLMSKYFNSDGSLVNVAGVVTTTDFNAFKQENTNYIGGLIDDINKDINDNYVKIEAFSGMFASAVDENGIAKTSQLASYVTKQTGEDGKTYLESGVIVKADNINLEGYTTINEHFRINTSGDMEAINGKFSGEIYANKGIIGGFSLANGYIGSAKVTWNDDGTPNIPKDRWGLALADTYMVFNGLKKQILLDIHDLTNPDNPDVITHFDGPLMRLEDTYKDTGFTMPKKGLVFDIANASNGRNFAFCGKGNGVLNGFIDGYGFDKRILTENDTYYDTAIRNSNRLIVNSKASGAGIVLPKLTEMINALGIDNTTPFAFRLTVIADIGSNDFKVLGRNTSASTGSGWNNAEYPVMVTWQNNVWGENEIGSSDSMEFLLVYDPSRTDTLDGFTTKWTARIINVLQG